MSQLFKVLVIQCKTNILKFGVEQKWGKMCFLTNKSPYFKKVKDKAKVFIYLFISSLTLITPATQIKTTKCQPRIERLQKEH